MRCENPNCALIYSYADGNKKVKFTTRYKIPDDELKKLSDRAYYINDSNRYIPCIDVKQTLLPCGKCNGCKLERSRQWAVRCQHEASQYRENCFLTLTYDNDHLPSDGKLVKKHVQDFLKRLRWHLDEYAGKKIRYYLVGEYGSKNKRPHYHAILFGYSPDDLFDFGFSNGLPIFRSHFLERTWTHGMVFVGSVTFESCAYVARYILKKVETDPEYKEFSLMSRRPGIGKQFYLRYQNDLYNYDKCVVYRKGKLVECRPPRYYDKLFEKDQPIQFLAIKDKRLDYSSSLDWPSHLLTNRVAYRAPSALNAETLANLPRNL